MSHIYDATFVESERVSAARFLKMADEQADIKAVRFVPPKLGRRGDFGSFVVEYVKPFYTVNKKK